MQRSKVVQVFLFFARMHSADGWDELIDGAIRRTEQLLRPGADAADERLCWFAAADANLQYRRICAANALQPGYAGSSGAFRDSRAAVAVAKQLRDTCFQDCAPLLRDEGFVFKNV